MTTDDYEVPDDYAAPDWANRQRVHDWKNYISEHLQAMWHTFTPDQKAAIAANAHLQAGLENWD
ncbi:recombinase RecA [Paraburkholderia sp. UCT31]|uniref:recombinase RecA n=1 Tax=Paraburkholderia sp. UCT31 TaxID=2615209 RepID=UPI001654E86F|nr:recombinase RecA [Paraburkholderia sp. UCT31]MBC8737003.1 recombinase RecA [Paraburkholderia sp. UCT31]